MILARVVGTVVSTRKVEPLRSVKLLVVEPVRPSGEPAGAHFVAADAVGAGAGETVLVAQGSSARLTDVSQDRPVDAVIMGIVDLVELRDEVVFRKSSS
jgi:microcompartment protein CcmK/EutM